MSWPMEVSLSRLTGERHAHEFEQRSTFPVCLRRGCDRDRHATGLFNLIRVNLRKNNLLAQTQRVIAPAVEGAIGDAFEVAHARQGDVDQPIKEFEHALAP